MLQSVYRRRKKSGRRWNGSRHRWRIVRLKREGDQDHSDSPWCGLPAPGGRVGQGGRHSCATSAQLNREYLLPEPVPLGWVVRSGASKLLALPLLGFTHPPIVKTFLILDIVEVCWGNFSGALTLFLIFKKTKISNAMFLDPPDGVRDNPQD